MKLATKMVAGRGVPTAAHVTHLECPEDFAVHPFPDAVPELKPDASNRDRKCRKVKLLLAPIVQRACALIYVKYPNASLWQVLPMFRDSGWDAYARKVSTWSAKREADAALEAEELLAKQYQVLNTSNARKLTSIEEAVTIIDDKLDQIIAGGEQLQEKDNIIAGQRAANEQVSASLLAAQLENCQLRERLAIAEERLAATQITDAGRVGPGSAPGTQDPSPLAEILAQASSPVQFTMLPIVPAHLPQGTELPPPPPSPSTPAAGMAWSTATSQTLNFQSTSADKFAGFGRAWFLPMAAGRLSVAEGIDAQPVKPAKKLGAWIAAGNPGKSKDKVTKQFQKYKKLVSYVLEKQHAITGEGSDATRAVAAFLRMDTIDEGKAYTTLNAYFKAMLETPRPKQPCPCGHLIPTTTKAKMKPCTKCTRELCGKCMREWATAHECEQSA